MQWFALEMQHNAQNAVYCTIDAHYAKLKSQTKCTKLLHICMMKYIASHLQQIGTHKVTYITRLQIYFGLEYTAKQVNEYNTL